MHYEFVELPSFASERDNLFSEDEYLEIQLSLCENSEAGGQLFQEQGAAANCVGEQRQKGNREGQE